MAERRGLLDLSIDGNDGDEPVSTVRSLSSGLDSPVVSFTKQRRGNSNWERPPGSDGTRMADFSRLPSEGSPLLGDSTDATLAEEEGYVIVDPMEDEMIASYDLRDNQYEDFHTIDWVRDRTRDSRRHKRLNRNKKESWRGWWEKLNDAWSGWILVFLVGLASGLAAGIIDIGSDWMGDLKIGICWSEFWLNKAGCCFLSNETTYSVHHCKEWKTWDEVFGASSGGAAYATNYFFYLIIAVAFATLSVVLVQFFAPYASGSGIPEVKTILSGFVIRGYLGAWTLIVKVLTMMTAVAAGLSLGKEGPLVHVACCCGNIFSRLFPKYKKNEAKKREVLSAASAAGVSVAFGAPIGGILFSLEEVSYYFPHKVLWRAFFSALTAMLVLTYMNPYFTGKLVMFYANYSGSWHIVELISFILLGVFGGLYGAIFIKGNLFWSKIRKTTKLGKHAILEVVVIVILTSLLGYVNPFTRPLAAHTIARLFRQCQPEDIGDSLCMYDLATEENEQDPGKIFGSSTPELWKAVWELAVACVFKGAITIFTFGIKVPAGLFIPTMFVGACFGRIFGILVQQLAFSHRTSTFFKPMCDGTAGCVIPGLYAMVGAASALGGVTKMTVSLVVIMFELTGGLSYIIPLMVGIMTSKWVADAFIKDGIYDGHIHLNGYPFMDSKEEFTHSTLASDVMKPRPRRNDPPIATIPSSGFTFGNIEDLLKETRFMGFPVVLSKHSQLLAGFTYRNDLIAVLCHAKNTNSNVSAESPVYFGTSSPRFTDPGQAAPVSLRVCLNKNPFFVTDSTPMETVIEIFRKMGLRQLLVTHNGRLLGIITKKDVLKHIAEFGNLDPDSILFH
eukprot:m.223290 g.223290  ORF g.223290 m.223290 type:complete len:844 (+) comp39981_c1_seq22:40-2571(+)